MCTIWGKTCRKWYCKIVISDYKALKEIFEWWLHLYGIICVVNEDRLYRYSGSFHIRMWFSSAFGSSLVSKGLPKFFILFNFSLALHSWSFTVVFTRAFHWAVASQFLIRKNRKFQPILTTQRVSLTECLYPLKPTLPVPPTAASWTWFY